MQFNKLLYLCIVSIWLITGCQANIQHPTQVIQEPEKKIKPSLVIWSYTDELITELEEFEERESCKIEFELIEANGFETMVDARIQDGENPDIIISDYETLMSETLDEYIYSLNDFSNKYQIDKYLNKDMIRKSYDMRGDIRGLSYHMTPIAIFYRRSIAKEILGTDNPLEVAKSFATNEKIYALALKLNENGMGIFPDPYAFRHFAPPISEEDKEISTAKQWTSYLKTLNNIKHYQLTPFYIEWSKEWFQGMKKGVFSYVLPNWGLSQILAMSAEDTSGDWGIVKGPYTREWGGTWLSLTQMGTQKELAEKFMKYILLDEEHQKEWLGDSYQLSSYNQVQKVQVYTAGNIFLGGQDYHQTFNTILGQGIDGTVNDPHSEEIIIRYINDEYHTIDEVIDVLDGSE